MKWALTPLLLVACTTAPPTVPDDKFFHDSYPMGKGFIQIIESNDTAPQSVPHIERFSINCNAARAAAETRFKATLNAKLKHTPYPLTERFDKNGACTVRVAFKAET